MFRRLGRIIFRTTAAGSTVLLLAVLALWPLSYFRWAAISYGTGTDWKCEIDSWAGRIGIYEEHRPGFPMGITCHHSQRIFSDAWRDWSYGDRSEFNSFYHYYRFLGCDYWLGQPRIAFYPARGLFVPHSYLAVLFAITPAFWVLKRKPFRADRLAKGLCPKCGYDLRASKERCPECGTLFAATGGTAK